MHGWRGRRRRTAVVVVVVVVVGREGVRAVGYRNNGVKSGGGR